MRLKEMRDLLVRHAANLRISPVPVVGASPPALASQEMKVPILEALQALSRVPGFAGECNKLLKHPVFQTTHVQAFAQEAIFNQFIQAMQQLETKARLLLEALTALVPPNLAIVAARLPVTDNLDQLAGDTKLLADAFSAAMRANGFEDDYKVEGFDRGTEWINILMQTPGALESLIAVLAAVATYLAKFRRDRDSMTRLQKIYGPDFSDPQKVALLKEMYFNEAVDSVAAKSPEERRASAEHLEALRKSIILFGSFVDKGGTLELPTNAGTPELSKQARVTSGALQALSEGKIVVGLLPEDAQTPVESPEEGD